MPFRTLVIIAALFTLPTSVLAQSADSSCREKYPVKNLTINFVEENTNHNPLEFLYRRCLTDQRKILMEERRQERLQERMNVRTQRTLSTGARLQETLGTHVRQAVQRQQNTRSQIQTRSNSPSIQTYVEQRRSRRSIVNEAEGFDRVNAILRRLSGQQQADLCKTVKVISGVRNPCRRYGSYR